MYKHILLPTDGSALSNRAVREGIRLARAVGARVTGLHVTPVVASGALEEWSRQKTGSGARLAAVFDRLAKRYVAEIAATAAKAGVRCTCLRASSNSPYEIILRTAAARRCDLIYMASHGKRGASAFLPGSETLKVLSRSPIPVLVHCMRRRPPAATRLTAKQIQQ